MLFKVDLAQSDLKIIHSYGHGAKVILSVAILVYLLTGYEDNS